MLRFGNEMVSLEVHEKGLADGREDCGLKSYDLGNDTFKWKFTQLLAMQSSGISDI